MDIYLTKLTIEKRKKKTFHERCTYDKLQNVCKLGKYKRVLPQQNHLHINIHKYLLCYK